MLHEFKYICFPFQKRTLPHLFRKLAVDTQRGSVARGIQLNHLLESRYTI